MRAPLSEALTDAAQQVIVEPTLAPALKDISQLADIEDSRATLESCIEQLVLADGSVVDILEAEQTYKDWRASHTDLLAGQSRAQTGEALVAEIRDVANTLNNPSMESSLFQSLKRSFHSMAMGVKTFGKNLANLRSKLNANKGQIEADPVLLDSPRAYAFLTRDNHPVKKIAVCIDEDLKFLAACEERYKEFFDKATEMGKRMHQAVNSDSNEAIREAIDYFDENILDRSELQGLSKFKLLGNRAVSLDKRGYPQLIKQAIPWKFSTKSEREDNLPTLLAKKKIHGFSIGGPLESLKGAVGINPKAATKQAISQISTSGGETEISGFIRVVDKTIALNSRTTKFAQMAAAMGEKVARLSADMDDAYNHVNTEKEQRDNAIRLRELRALHRAARRSVSQYMFLGKAIATLMEDHSSYLYRNIALIANDVLKNTTKD